jgi:uncharacterized membrane protein YdcZ (DUF606 family)
MDSRITMPTPISINRQSQRDRARLFVLLLLASVLMGTFLPITKAASHAGAQALSHAFWTSLGSGLVVMLIARLFRAAIRVEKNQLFFYLLTGSAGANLVYRSRASEARYQPVNEGR